MTDSLPPRLRLYDVAADLDRPRARILAWAAGLHEALVAAAAAEDAIDYMMQNDTRRFLFMLEGLFRLYRKRYGDVIDQLLVRTKAFEDRLGAVDYAIYVQAHGQRLDLPKKARRYLSEQLCESRRRAAKLAKKRWLPGDTEKSRGIAKMIRFLMAIPWDDDGADLTYLRTELARRLRKIRDADYDMTDLEQGVHELRRQLRWLPIYLVALDGFAALDPGLLPVPEYEPLLQDPVADSPFAQLPASLAEPGPVALSQSLYIANTKLIAELGALKDEAQLINAMTQALYEGGAVGSRKKGKKRALELLGKTAADEERVYGRCAEIYAEVRRTDLPGHFAAELDPPAPGD